jgi:hypothetical protein
MPPTAVRQEIPAVVRRDGAAPPQAVNPGALADPVFVLGAPRSCTSVVAAMLGRHPELYGLPETHLFQCETVGQWWRKADEVYYKMRHGLLRAVAEVYFGGQTEATVRRARAWLLRRLRLTTGAVLEALAERVHPRALVDKSPSVVWEVAWMRRARAMFPRARFVHLVRHPRAHGQSVMRLVEANLRRGPLPPSHWLRELCTYPPPDGTGKRAVPLPGRALDPQFGWYALNRNVAEFLAGIPAGQSYRVRAEAVLADPDGVLPTLARWLGLRDDAAAVEEMKHPERSPFARLGPPGARFGGDVFFLKDPVLRPQRARPTSLEGPLPWQSDGAGFAPEVHRLAEEFGYT